MQIVQTDEAPTPRGHYSQAVEHGGLLYVAVQLPIPASGDTFQRPTSIEGQAEQALANVLAIVRAGGGSVQTLLRVTVYVSDIAHWPAVNAVYERVMGNARPARGVVPTGQLHLGYDVAVEATAFVAEPR